MFNVWLERLNNLTKRNQMKIFSHITLILLSVAILSSCSDDSEDPTPATTTTTEDLDIVGTAMGSKDLSILVDALKAADGDLVGLLQGQGPFTVLAPTNTAFTTFLKDNGFAKLEDVPTDILANILKNHVISGELKAEDLTKLGSGYSNTSATGPNGKSLSIYFNTTEGVKFNGISSVATPDVQASNGVVHIVDAVIGLPTIVDFALANPALSNLVDALMFADENNNPSPNLVKTLSAPGEFTVFAPIDDAFAALLKELDPTGMTSLTDLSGELVASVLTQHVVTGNITSSDLTSGPVKTLGGDVTLDAAKLTITDMNDRETNIIAALVDIQASNGVVHAIDKVILPKL